LKKVWISGEENFFPPAGSRATRLCSFLP